MTGTRCNEAPRLWFFGGGSFAARCLRVIHRELPFELVVTAPPSRGGRGMGLIPSPVQTACEELGIVPRHSARVRDDDALRAMALNSPPLAILVTDFGQKIPEPFLSAPAKGCLHIHPSLLPRYRGAAPVQRAHERRRHRSHAVPPGERWTPAGASERGCSRRGGYCRGSS